MGSTDSDRSISSSISIPQWMKSKIGDRYDIEETFSPPTNDDTFFYIRYPKSKSSQQSEDNSYHPISEVFEEKKKTIKEQDFSKHTQPCREFIPQIKMTSEGYSSTTNSVSQSQFKINKSQGTDDGYTGEGAACGKSVVQVAHQMIAGNKLSWIGAEQDIPTRERRRRNSKSLPASPLSTPDVSPKLSRRKPVEPQNRYFTGVFGVPPQYPGSWILSGVLGHRDVSTQQTVYQTLPEEQESTDKQKSDIRRNKSMSSLARAAADGSKEEDQTLSDGEVSPGIVKKEMTFRAKPSELREMNFWSPTSM